MSSRRGLHLSLLVNSTDLFLQRGKIEDLKPLLAYLDEMEVECDEKFTGQQFEVSLKVLKLS